MNDWLSPHPLWIVGHRGAPRRARENTIESFDFAEADGADAVEFDLQQSRDGELFVFHDPEIAIGSEKHAVRDMASIDIRSLLLDSPFGEYRIPSFETVLTRYGAELKLLAEMKTTPRTDRGLAARRIVELIRGFHAEGRCAVSSFDADFLKKVKDRHPQIVVSFLFREPVVLPGSGEPSTLPSCEGVGPWVGIVTPELVSQAKAAHLSVHPWTADEPEEIERLAALGVSSITTNDTAMARRIVPR